MSPVSGKYRCFSILHLAHGSMDGVQQISDENTFEESGGNDESLCHYMRCQDEINAVWVVHENQVANQGDAQ